MITNRFPLPLSSHPHPLDTAQLEPTRYLYYIITSGGVKFSPLSGVQNRTEVEILQVNQSRKGREKGGHHQRVTQKFPRQSRDADSGKIT